MSLPDTSASSTGPLRRTGARVVALALAFVLSVLVPSGAAVATVLDGDRIGGEKAGSRPGLRESAPDLYIPAGMLTTMDGRELWARDTAAQRAMASTTKIMTAIVALEKANLDDVVTYRKAGMTADELVVGFADGEKLTVRELLEASLIESGNEAATMLAIHVGGSVDGFAKMMNDKAAELDLANTHYVNAHGLDAAGHYSSAADLTALARYAMRNPEFRRIVGVYKMNLVTAKHTYKLTNTNLMLKIYQGAFGVKTGWTDDAGYNVVVAAKRGDVELVATVMGAASEQGRFGQATRLLDWGFAHYKSTTVANAGERTGNVVVSDYIDLSVPTETAESTSVLVFDLAGEVKRRITLDEEVSAPVQKGQRLGTLTVYQGERLLAQLPLVSTVDVPEPTFWQRVQFFFVRAWRSIFGR